MTFENALILAEDVKSIDDDKVKDLSNQKSKRGIRFRGLVVLDIDDTLLKASSAVIKCYKSIDGKEIPLTTAQFATDPDKKKMGSNVIMYDVTPPKKGIAFSVREFNDPEKVYKSIVTGTPIVKNLQKMDEYIRKGWDVSFLTARGLEGTVNKSLKDFLKYRQTDGTLTPVGSKLKSALSAAVNDKDIKYLGRDDGEKKANVLKKLCSYYTYVVFIDDDDRNTKAADALGIENLRVVKAAKLEDTVKELGGEK